MLVLSFSAWAQAVCPMMLFPPPAQDCGKQALHPAATPGQGSAHECCPGMKAPMTHEQCERVKLSSRKSALSCCAVEIAPASAPKVPQAGTGIAVLGRMMPSALQSPSRVLTIELSDAGPPSRGILSLKEDLRI
jgi:hypothetical protein